MLARQCLSVGYVYMLLSWTRADVFISVTIALQQLDNLTTIAVAEICSKLEFNDYIIIMTKIIKLQFSNQ